MKDILKLTVKLFVITVIAGLLLGATYVITEEPIAEQEAQAATAARQQVLPAAAEFEEFDLTALAGQEEYESITAIHIGKDASGEDVGATIQMTAKGFNPGINMTVGVSGDGTVTGVYIGSNEETPGLGARATEPEFYEQYTGKPADGSLSVIKNGTPGETEIVAIAGATITSEGVTTAVNLAAQCYLDYVKD